MKTSENVREFYCLQHRSTYPLIDPDIPFVPFASFGSWHWLVGAFWVLLTGGQTRS